MQTPSQRHFGSVLGRFMQAPLLEQHGFTWQALSAEMSAWDMSSPACGHRAVASPQSSLNHPCSERDVNAASSQDDQSHYVSAAALLATKAAVSKALDLVNNHIDKTSMAMEDQDASLAMQLQAEEGEGPMRVLADVQIAAKVYSMPPGHATEHGTGLEPCGEETAPPCDDPAPPCDDPAPPCDDPALPHDDAAAPCDDPAQPHDETALPRNDAAPSCDDTALDPCSPVDESVEVIAESPACTPTEPEMTPDKHADTAQETPEPDAAATHPLAAAKPKPKSAPKRAAKAAAAKSRGAPKAKAKSRGAPKAKAVAKAKVKAKAAKKKDDLPDEKSIKAKLHSATLVASNIRHTTNMSASWFLGLLFS